MAEKNPEKTPRKYGVGAKKSGSAEPRGTNSLPLKGEKEQDQKGLDGSVIKEKPEPKVIEAAKAYAKELEKIEDGKDDANEAAAKLETVLKATKKKPYVRIVTDRQVWEFEVQRSSRLVKKKTAAVK